MINTLFLQSEVADPYALYAEMRKNAPVCHDRENGIWAVYTHAACRQILESDMARIPPQNPASLPLMNASSTTLTDGFARLANPPRHAARRDAVMRLFASMRPVDGGRLLAELIPASGECDWVGAVARKLPALAVLRAFDFSDSDAATVLDNIERLTKIMLPNKTAQQMEGINAAAECILASCERQLARVGLAGDAQERSLLAANLVGLLVQSVDAGRGLLCNALLQALRLPVLPQGEGWQRMVVETMRYDPPIQNTRRVLAGTVEAGGIMLPEGAAVLLVLASANRDEAVFADAGSFSLQRGNNADQLGFGAGAHVCPAHRFTAELAAGALAAFFGEGRCAELLQPDIAYEPMVNARLPREILLRYSS